MTALRIANRQARHLWLHQHGLARPPTGEPDIGRIIRDLGFVQLDSIQVVSRAHHHILWSRNQSYREDMLDRHLAEERGVFEHFTHDASVLPMEYLPMWRRQFRRKQAELDRMNWFRGLPGESERARIKARIAREGAMSTHAFDTRISGKRQMWSRPPHKLALDYMWYGGELATCHRINFTKYYDLAERVFPADLAETEIPDEEQVAWLCSGALDRLGVATAAEIRKFWEATDPQETRAWLDRTPGLVPVEIETAEGAWSPAVAPSDIEERLAALSRPSGRMRILSPFDPAIRDRARLRRLFGFDYRVEMFVPAARRVWGYYVFPLLERDRFVGRIEVKADRRKAVLIVLNLWPERGIAWTPSRQEKLDAELARLARFVGAREVTWP